MSKGRQGRPIARKATVAQGLSAAPTTNEPCAADRQVLMRLRSGPRWIKPKGDEEVALRWQDSLLTIVSRRGSIAVFDIPPEDILDCMNDGWLFEGQAHEGGPDDDVVRVTLRGRRRNSH